MIFVLLLILIVDFIYSQKPVEVKYQENISKQDLKATLEFMREFRVKEGYLISKNKFDKIQIDRKIIKILPAWYLCLQKI